MKKPYVLGWECEGHLYIRFEDTEATHADAYAELFRSHLSYTINWECEQNAYRLTLHAMQEACVLAEHYFGPRSFTYLGVGLH